VKGGIGSKTRLENGSKGGKVVCDVFMMVGGVVDRRREELSFFSKVKIGSEGV
jgi:hypothetical protein